MVSTFWYSYTQEHSDSYFLQVMDLALAIIQNLNSDQSHVSSHQQFPRGIVSTYNELPQKQLHRSYLLMYELQPRAPLVTTTAILSLMEV